MIYSIDCNCCDPYTGRGLFKFTQIQVNSYVVTVIVKTINKIAVGYDNKTRSPQLA